MLKCSKAKSEWVGQDGNLSAPLCGGNNTTVCNEFIAENFL